MIVAIKERYSQFEPQAPLSALFDLVPDILAAIVVLAAFSIAFRLSRRPLRMVFHRAGMQDKLTTFSQRAGLMPKPGQPKQPTWRHIT